MERLLRRLCLEEVAMSDSAGDVSVGVGAFRLRVRRGSSSSSSSSSSTEREADEVAERDVILMDNDKEEIVESEYNQDGKNETGKKDKPAPFVVRLALSFRKLERMLLLVTAILHIGQVL